MGYYTRTEEKNGTVIYSTVGIDPPVKLVVSPYEAYRRKLIELLEKAGGDKAHEICIKFWTEQADKFKDDAVSRDEMQRRYRQDIYDRLCSAWDELTTPPPVTDYFAEFDL